MSVTDNTTVATMPRISRAGLLDTGRRAATVRDLIDRLGIRPPRPEMPVRHLSAWVAELKARVLRCFEAGALATGCDLATAPVGLDYADLRPDAAMLSLYRANAEALGRVFPDLSGGSPVGAATDMGSVSHVVPTLLGLDCLPAVNHRPEFTAACVTPAADKVLLDGATAMAWTAIGLACS